MPVISPEIANHLQHSSMIRRMFEAGIALKKEHGADKVCDFSLGNPDLPAPTAVVKAMHDLAAHSGEPLFFGYMPNGGYPWAREALAAYLSQEQETNLSGREVILTCGAAGGLNALFKAILSPGDEVLAPAPYFVEYGFYVGNHLGVFRPVPSLPKTFQLDLAAMEAAITPKTRAVIINTPHNPTGQVYSAESLKALSALLARKSAEYGRPIILVSDEPYRFLTFDGIKVPALLPLYEYAVVAGSFSKSLGLAGERIGYLAMPPHMPGRERLEAALMMTNRILGFVNPPAVGQHLMAAALGSQVDVSIYVHRRDAMAKVLRDAGIDFAMPQGAFYFFPEAPGGDDKAFAACLTKELILAVPGSGFGLPGHFRLAFCTDEAVILRAAEGFKRAAAACR